MDLAIISQLLAEQGGVISRRQVLEAGGQDAFIERMLRRREWNRAERGVFVNHTGQLSWDQRAWAAVLSCWPAALADESAVRAAGLRLGSRAGLGFSVKRESMSAPVHVAIDAKRRARRSETVRVHRVRDLARYLHPNRRPPRMRLEDAVLRLSSRAGTASGAIAILADACQSRRTTPARLASALEGHPTLHHRNEFLAVLHDVASGAYSLLEHRYLTRVERPHGLPESRRQARVTSGGSTTYRDAEYREERTVVELDGRLGHEETLDQWDDLDRDIHSAVGGDLTLRVGWRHVDDPCRTAAAVGRVLQARGWAGALHPCGPNCNAADRPA